MRSRPARPPAGWDEVFLRGARPACVHASRRVVRTARTHACASCPTPPAPFSQVPGGASWQAGQGHSQQSVGGLDALTNSFLGSFFSDGRTRHFCESQQHRDDTRGAPTLVGCTLLSLASFSFYSRTNDDTLRPRTPPHHIRPTVITRNGTMKIAMCLPSIASGSHGWQSESRGTCGVCHARGWRPG